MPLTDDEQATLRRLKARLDRDLRGGIVDGQYRYGFRALRAYLEGTQRLIQLGIAIPEELREFVTIVAWPETLRDAIVQRMRPQGFTIDGLASDTIDGYWSRNNLDTEIRMALADMVGYGRGYLCAGAADVENQALVTVESPFQMIHEWSNRHRRVTAAARFYVDDSEGKKTQLATLYLPRQTKWLVRHRGKWIEDPSHKPDEHDVDRVLVQPLVNRATSDDRYGRSEILTIIGLTDACARALTNAQVATEVMALPQRWAAGMTGKDFVDPKTGEQVTAWEAYFGAVWATSNHEAKFGQFTAAELSNFKTIVSVYAQAASGLTGLPMRYFGQIADNPPSADGIRADEARLVGKVEEKQLFADGPLEESMRSAHLIATGSDTGLEKLQTVWRSAGTQSRAQEADAAVKLHADGVVSRRQALRDLGYTPPQIEGIEEEIAEELRARAAASRDQTLERLARGLIDGGADDLVDENADTGSGA